MKPLKFMDEIDAARAGHAFLAERSFPGARLFYSEDNDAAQAPRLKWNGLFDQDDNLRAAFFLTRDLKNWTQVSFWSHDPVESAGAGVQDDLVMLVVRLARALKKASPTSELPAAALEFLTRHDLNGSPLRTDD